MTASITRTRSVLAVIPAYKQVEGGGFVVRRPFPTRTLLDFDPFLLLDHLGPTNYGPGEAIGAPDHPHRGFETVTYILEGKLEHKDSKGNHGVLGSGDVQWMTAGAGVIHSEMPEAEFKRQGGVMHGFQLWVNLPQRDKWMKPRYQDISSEKIPTASSENGGVQVRVIAGEAMGVSAVIDTRIPIMFLHYTLQPGEKATQSVPSDFNLFGYVISGRGYFGSEKREAGEARMVVFEKDGDEVSFAATENSTLDLLLIGGVPIDEPVVRWGPFVMNTEEEIYQAIEDYRNGRMGEIYF